jgi:hypothetical protein
MGLWGSGYLLIKLKTTSSNKNINSKVMQYLPKKRLTPNGIYFCTFVQNADGLIASG